MSEYDNLLDAARKEAAVFRAKASEYVPKMYEALRLEGVDPTDAKDRIEKDLADTWNKDTIRRNLPDEAKNRKISETVKSTNRERKSKKMGLNPISERQILVGADGSSHSAEDEPSRIERLPDQGDFTTRSQAVAAEEKSKDEQIAYLESRVKELETQGKNNSDSNYEVQQLRSLLKPFTAQGKLFYKNEVFPYSAEIDPQARRITSSEINELEARRANR